jgi:hypothetical protein
VRDVNEEILLFVFLKLGTPNRRGRKPTSVLPIYHSIPYLSGLTRERGISDVDENGMAIQTSMNLSKSEDQNEITLVLFFH